MDRTYMLKRFSSLSDEQLAAVLGSKRDSYLPEAIEVAAQVAESRGLTTMATSPERPPPAQTNYAPDLYMMLPDRRESGRVSPRIKRAMLVSPPVAVLLFVAGSFIAEPGDADSTLVELLPMAFFYSMWLLPVAYLAGLGLGWPAYRMLQRAGRLRLSCLAGAGMLIGPVVFAVGMSLIWLPLVDGYLGIIALTGAVAGGAAGAVFWLVGLRS
jgi:hypothetical protein